jgi:hypothetical protein
MTESIEELLDIKEYRLANEESTLKKFQEAESKLFEATSPQPAKRTLTTTVSRAGTSLQVKGIMKIGEELFKNCSIKPTSGTRAIKISGVLCFARVNVNKQKAECTITLDTKVYHKSLTYTFTKITERFEPWNEINKLRLISHADGTLTIECA